MIFSDSNLAMGASTGRLVPPPYLKGVPLSTSSELYTTNKGGSPLIISGLGLLSSAKGLLSSTKR